MAKRIFWKLPLSSSIKEKMRSAYFHRKLEREGLFEYIICTNNKDMLHRYAVQVLSLPLKEKSEYYTEFCWHEVCHERSAILVAYYLTQYSPDKHNDEWWGKGNTEWDNVTSAVPQFVGHYQPRLPGELGFYDLRVKDNMKRQIELAKNYGIEAFNFYYYWFDGERILENAFNQFLQDPTLDISFMICFANENWTKKYSGTDNDILISMTNTTENYKKFIFDAMDCFKDPRYLTVDGKLLLEIYRPDLLPDSKEIIKYWKTTVYKVLGRELCVIAAQLNSEDWCALGFDFMNERAPSRRIRNCVRNITEQMNPVRRDFAGEIYDYQDLVMERKYLNGNNTGRKAYNTVMPMWDNTARRNQRGDVWHGSTPDLYKQWLKDVIRIARENECLSEPIVFINAWNEWGEGAYLEPDKKYGYAYLQATWEAKQESQIIVS